VEKICELVQNYYKLLHKYKKKLGLVNDSYLGVHLRVEKDWVKARRGFPPPEVLVQNLKQYKTEGVVYIACGEPLDSPMVVPYVEALTNASYIVKTKPDLGPYLGHRKKYFDFIGLIDFEILKNAYASFGLQYSTFYIGVYSARHMNGKNRTVYVAPYYGEELYTGWLPWEYNQNAVDQTFQLKYND